MALNERQKDFAAEYIVDLNATQAAIRAGYSAKTAYSQGWRLLKNVEIQSEIQDEMKRRSERTELSQDYVVEKLKEITDKDASDAQDSELRYANKIRALELLGKHLGLFERGQSAGAETSGGVILIPEVADGE